MESSKSEPETLAYKTNSTRPHCAAEIEQSERSSASLNKLKKYILNQNKNSLRVLEHETAASEANIVLIWQLFSYAS